MRRGEVWTANLNPPRGQEIGKIRPVVVMQADKLGGDLTLLVVVLPLTTKVYPTQNLACACADTGSTAQALSGGNGPTPGVGPCPHWNGAFDYPYAG